MKSLTRHLTLPIDKRMGFLNITQQIFYGEFDGRRDKRVLVKIIGE